MEIKSPACTASKPCLSCVFSSVLAQTQLKVAEQDKRILQEQVSQLQQEVSSYSLEIVDLNERLKRSRRKLSERKRQSQDKYYSSKWVDFKLFNNLHPALGYFIHLVLYWVTQGEACAWEAKLRIQSGQCARWVTKCPQEVWLWIQVETLPKALTKSCCRRKQSFSPGKLVGVFINVYTAIS